MSQQHIACARAARHEFAEAFETGINEFRSCRINSYGLARTRPTSLPHEALRNVMQFRYEPEVASMAFEGIVEKTNKIPQGQKNFVIMARPRPMDRCACLTTEVGNNAIVSHDGRVHRDGRTLYLVHSRFHLDHVFASTHGNKEVFNEACLPLINHALAGQRATLLFFGQTGTGKTYTTFGVQEELGKHLEAMNETFSLKIFELAGQSGKETGFDLLSERQKVKVLEGADGYVHIRGAKETHCADKITFDEALDVARAFRCSAVTDRNAHSSRSHCIFELSFSSGGLLRLVDLAGSERNVDSSNHDTKLTSQGGLINSSLQNLKECARILYQKSCDGTSSFHVPFRRSKLTHLLKDCFVDAGHKTVCVGALSPQEDDVEHTLNTLQHLVTMRGGSDRRKERQAEKENQRRSKASDPRNKDGNFQSITGRGANLHSKLQDNNQLDLHCFGLVGPVGGGILKKYDPENVKYESFIDARFHPELWVSVKDDLWVYQEADKEVIHPLKGWQEEQFQKRREHLVTKWSCEKVQSFLKHVFRDSPHEVRLPAQMDGNMLQRLGTSRLQAILGKEAAEVLQAALAAQQKEGTQIKEESASRNSKIQALSQRKIQYAMVSKNDNNELQCEEL